MLLSPLLKYVAGGLAALALLLGIALHLERRHSRKLQAQVVKLEQTLRDISTRKNEQKDRSERNVDKVVKGDPVIRETVRVIREAPIPEGCKTPALPELRNAV